MIVIVRCAFANDSNSNFFVPQLLPRRFTHWHIGISCFFPRGMVIQLLQLLKIVCLRLRSPALVGHAGASLSAQGLCPARRGLPPAIPARGPRSPSRHGHGRPRLKAWTGLVAAVTALKTLPGPCRDAVRGCTEVLSEIVFVASVLPDASSLFWQARARFVAATRQSAWQI